eukprot:8463537-Pyramimonas_sp.AAC.1
MSIASARAAELARRRHAADRFLYNGSQVEFQTQRRKPNVNIHFLVGRQGHPRVDMRHLMQTCQAPARAAAAACR